MILPRLDYAFARRHGVILRDTGCGTPECAHLAKTPLSALVEAQRCAARDITFHEMDSSSFDTALSGLYSNSATQAAQIAAEDETDLTTLAETAASVDDLLDQKDDAPVVRLINALLLEAVKANASDVHIELEETRLVVRFRVDGALREVLEPRRALAPLLASRLKIMGKLDIAEKRLPQDGRVSLKVGGYALDVRISTLPSQYGERVVLRLLDRGQTRLGIPALGMSETDRARFERMISSPEGLVLVTGPTGSGKTTSLYAALQHLNDRARNILTVEDPIEYAMDGVGQMQVDAKTGLTFARGLRALLRQDPDVIMVGEIRDSETARIAVESAMTGHLVLSTLHTNTAVGAVSRLLDMGVERYLLAPMLRGLVAQRLVRRLCQACREPHPLSARDAALLGHALPEGAPAFHAPGCEVCAQEGYRGRLPIYEVVTVEGRMEAMIHDGASEADLIVEARKSSGGILQDGLEKITAGLTRAEDVARAVRDRTDGVI
ncbi:MULTISPECIES: GspE/PulE family protein [unclassified Marinovum]